MREYRIVPISLVGPESDLFKFQQSLISPNRRSILQVLFLATSKYTPRPALNVERSFVVGTQIEELLR